MFVQSTYSALAAKAASDPFRASLTPHLKTALSSYHRNLRAWRHRIFIACYHMIRVSGQHILMLSHHECTCKAIPYNTWIVFGPAPSSHARCYVFPRDTSYIYVCTCTYMTYMHMSAYYPSFLGIQQHSFTALLHSSNQVSVLCL